MCLKDSLVSFLVYFWGKVNLQEVVLSDGACICGILIYFPKNGSPEEALIFFFENLPTGDTVLCIIPLLLTPLCHSSM